jgi:DNA-binding response OmpR family regulator
MNVLIADDEEVFRNMLRDCLAVDPMIEVTCASNASEAWWHLGNPDQIYDLGIFDIKMPVVSGYELLKRVRTCKRYRHLPVIMCSGMNDRETVISCTQLDASYYLVKPFKIATLIAKIHELGDRRRARVAPRVA